MGVLSPLTRVDEKTAQNPGSPYYLFRRQSDLTARTQAWKVEGVNQFGDVTIHHSGETHFSVVLRCTRRHGDDRNPPILAVIVFADTDLSRST
jgi:hypothetical protein